MVYVSQHLFGGTKEMGGVWAQKKGPRSAEMPLKKNASDVVYFSVSRQDQRDFPVTKSIAPNKSRKPELDTR